MNFLRKKVVENKMLIAIIILIVVLDVIVTIKLNKKMIDVLSDYIYDFEMLRIEVEKIKSPTNKTENIISR